MKSHLRGNHNVPARINRGITHEGEEGVAKGGHLFWRFSLVETSGALCADETGFTTAWLRLECNECERTLFRGVLLLCARSYIMIYTKK